MTDEIIIRLIQNSDLANVGDLVYRSMLPSLKDLSEETKNYFKERNSEKQFSIGRESVLYFVAEFKHTIVGVIGLDTDTIRTFYVDPIFQGKGIGKILYLKIKDLALQNGVDELITQSSPIAEPVYAKLGFRKIRKIWKKYDDGSKSYTVLMKQKLA